MKRLLAGITLVILSACASEPETNADQIASRESADEYSVADIGCEYYFHYDEDTIDWRDDDHVLYSPVIELHYSNKWTSEQLRQLDSIIDFAQRHDVPDMTIDVVSFAKYDLWSNEDTIKAFINRRIKNRNLKHTSAGYYNGYLPYKYCKNVDSLFQKQIRDSIYFIVLHKRTAS